METRPSSRSKLVGMALHLKGGGNEEKDPYVYTYIHTYIHNASLEYKKQKNQKLKRKAWYVEKEDRRERAVPCILSKSLHLYLSLIRLYVIPTRI